MCDQILMGKKSMYKNVYGIKMELQGADKLLEFVAEVVVTYHMHYNNERMESSKNGWTFFLHTKSVNIAPPTPNEVISKIKISSNEYCKLLVKDTLWEDKFKNKYISLIRVEEKDYILADGYVLHTINSFGIMNAFSAFLSLMPVLMTCTIMYNRIFLPTMYKKRLHW